MPLTRQGEAIEPTGLGYAPSGSAASNHLLTCTILTMSNLFQSQHWLDESLLGLQDTLAAWKNAYPDMGVFAMVPEA